LILFHSKEAATLLTHVVGRPILIFVKKIISFLGRF